MRAVVELGGWAWYEFAGYLRRGNKEALHIASTEFNEPTLLALLPQTEAVATFHGSDEIDQAVVYVGGTENQDTEHICGVHGSNITNRGRRAEGIQMEFSREARNLLFPPDASREARGRRSARLRPLARSIHLALKRLTAKKQA